MRPVFNDHNTARQIRAFGEVKSVHKWALDKRCFLSKYGLAFRVNRFPGDLTENDAEAAMCLTPRLWRFYREYGTVPQEVLDDELGPPD